MQLNNLMPSTFSARLRMQIYAKNLDVTINNIPWPPTDEYRQRTGTGKVPSLEVDGMTLIESTAIGEFFEDLGRGPSLRPTAPLERACMRMLIQISDHYIAPNLVPFIMAVVRGSHDPAVLAAARPKLMDGLKLLEERIGGGAYAVGSSLSLADCALVPPLLYITMFLPMLGIAGPLRDFPRTARYFAAIQKHSAAAKIIGEMTVPAH